MNVFDKRPLSLILCITLGGFVFFTLGDTFLRILLIATALLLLCVFLYFLFKKSNKHIIGLAAAALAVGILFSHIYFDLIFNPFDKYEGECNITATVTDYDPNSYSTSFTLEVKSVNENKIYGRKIILRLERKEALNLDVGYTVNFDATLEGFEATENFDAKSYYYSEGISAQAVNASNLEIVQKGDIPLTYRLTEMREHIRRHAVMLSDEKTGNMLSALILGERDNLDQQTRLDFTRIGINHILALSGLHLSILAYALNGLLSILRIKKKTRYIITVIFVFFYMAITGFSVSVVRAGIMLIISYLLFLFSRPHDSLTSLTLSVLIICTLTPYSVYDISLWLSAFATLGVIIAAELHISDEADEFFPKAVMKNSLSALIISVFAISATYFISAFTFGGISLLSVFSGIIFSFLAEIIINIGAIMLIFGSFIPIRMLLIPITEFTTNFAAFLSEADFAYISIDNAIIKALLIVSAVLFFAFLVIKIKSKKCFITIILIAFLITNITGTVCHAIAVSDDDVLYSSSNKCDIILIKSNSESCIINSSQYSQSTANRAAAILNAEKITHLNSYLITHYSWNLSDHLTTLLSSVPIDDIYIPIPRGKDEVAMAETLLVNTENYRADFHFIDSTFPILCGEFTIHHDFNSEYDSGKALCAVRFYRGDKIYTYLSVGMLENDSYPTYNNISSSDVVIFGSYGSKYTEDIYIDRFYESIDTVIHSGAGPFFDQKTYEKYIENGCEFYSHPQSISIYEN